MGDFCGQSTNGGEPLRAPESLLPLFPLSDVPQEANSGRLAFMAGESETSMHGDGHPVFAGHIDLISLVKSLSPLSESVALHALLKIIGLD